jgi:hypothetical protein
MKRIANLLKAKEKKAYLTFIKEDYLIGEFLLALLFIVASIVFPFFSYAQKSKDGSYSYSPGTSTTIIGNRYSALASSAASGATSVTVSNISELAGSYSFTNSVNGYAVDALSAGDLVMIIQMQGATMTTTDNTAYGAVASGSYNNTGNYELRTVSSVSSNTINFCVALTNSYTQTGTRRSQVVRIPRLYNVTLGSNVINAAMPWNGTTGGVCSIEVEGALVLNGTMSASATGFRGGVDPNKTSSIGGNTFYRTTTTTGAAGKGESIAGNSTDYTSLNGAYGRGAPANGGGGGMGDGGGAGGGSNIGSTGLITPWDGTGIKPTGYNAPWNLEAINFATSTSLGGGRGGYTYSTNAQSPSLIAPGNVLWGGDSRKNVGGFGGHALDYNSNTRLFMGGGGGAGETDTNQPTEGGIGGGIVYLLVTGSITGTGSVQSNAGNGGTVSTDGGGGGGGGGAVVVLSNSTITGIVINAKGGNGGNVTGTSAVGTGPGGSGGGGYILTTTTSVTTSVIAGTNGTIASSSFTTFPPNGATKGDAGMMVNTGSFLFINDCFKEINGLSAPSCTPGTGTITASGTIINSYYAGTASTTVGATRISVDTLRTAGSAVKISPGDLLLVVQMQGSTINSANTSAYGSNTASYIGYLTTIAGTYEYVYAASGVVNNTVYLTTPLRNTYTSSAASGTAGRYTFQVVRVPQYSTLTINASAGITVVEWDGSTGGIVAANVAGTMTLNGGVAITASNLGFRGGGGRQLTGGAGVNTDTRTLSSNNNHGSKGEGIAGTPRYTRSLANVLVDNLVEGYPNGSYAKGAPGNAGGGGTDAIILNNSENTGGGGGGNGGAGGLGGKAWNTPTKGSGGYGGALFAETSISRLIMGGGGGAGSTNNGTGSVGTNGFSSSGGSGGGMVFLKVNDISGSGTIEANGATGLSVLADGAGAGGAGGSVYLYSTVTTGLANVTINAKGGNGGNAWPLQVDVAPSNDGSDEHGPGGGGGGGVIYTNGTINAASSVSGGTNGITTTSNLSYGSVAGSVGVKATTATDMVGRIVKTYCDIDDDNDGITDVNENPSSVDPFSDADNDGTPNVYDETSGTTVAWADTNNDEINDNYDADKDGRINELDIDSDNDGITDNVEAQGTSSYKVPTDVDTDADGLNDVYELAAQIGLPTGNGLTPIDTDTDGVPDYLDADSDGDGLMDRNEGADRNYPAFVSLSQATIDASGDTDDDGLMDVFDNVNNDALTTNYYTNSTMGNMGPLGNFAGPSPSGSLVGLVKSDPAASDRDWRNSGYAILPLQILNFSVSYQSPIANIKWSVANELQTHYYEVEMSLNGTDFETVQKVGAKNVGSSSYTFPHSLANQPSGTIYYRIKQVDKNSKTFYTQIIAIKIAKASIPLTVSPNPFQSFINIAYTSELKEMVSLAIYSSEGKMVASKRAEVVKGTNSIQFASLETLPSGTYILQVQGANTGQSSKIIKH